MRDAASVVTNYPFAHLQILFNSIQRKPKRKLKFAFNNEDFV